jgi:hypothetical protein
MRNEDADAHAYEQPVRDHARRYFESFGERCVERRFLVATDFFANGENVAAFEEIVQWMNEAHITVSLGRRDDARDRPWLDFALVGNVAVSRFDSTGGISNRVLEESFSGDEIATARSVWNNRIEARWTSGLNGPLQEVLAARGGRI